MRRPRRVEAGGAAEITHVRSLQFEVEVNGHNPCLPFGCGGAPGRRDPERRELAGGVAGWRRPPLSAARPAAPGGASATTSKSLMITAILELLRGLRADGRRVLIEGSRLQLPGVLDVVGVADRAASLGWPSRPADVLQGVALLRLLLRLGARAGRGGEAGRLLVAELELDLLLRQAQRDAGPQRLCRPRRRTRGSR